LSNSCRTGSRAIGDFPIEQSIATVPKIEEIRSISRFGLSVITVVFDDDVDIYFARQLIGERLKEAVDQIPQGIGKPELAPVSTGLGEVYQYIIHPKKEAKRNTTQKICEPCKIGLLPVSFMELLELPRSIVSVVSLNNMK
jgi:Cu/Ag efflux pump CusA